MKKLDFEQMEQIEGGIAYCDLLCGWWEGDLDGFQGDWLDLKKAIEKNC
nr:hypothetical protein [uncultured Carboxylicivirga sp.]